MNNNIQSEQLSEIQDILEYLDTVLYPIISLDYWDVYSKLYDMISMLPIAQPERKVGKWIDDCICSICHWIHEDNNGFALLTNYHFCPNCGADMRGEEDE